MNRTKVKCEICGKEISKSNITKHLKSHETHPEYHDLNKGKYKLTHDGLVCQFCGKECKNRNSLCNHERLCKNNPDKQIIRYPINNKKRPEHIASYYTKPYKTRSGDILDVTKADIDAYRLTHKVCEICGRPVEDTVKWDSKFAAKNLCIDHDHNTNHFRGLLCSVCNRQLGWYEKYKNEISDYLNK